MVVTYFKIPNCNVFSDETTTQPQFVLRTPTGVHLNQKLIAKRHLEQDEENDCWTKVLDTQEVYALFRNISKDCLSSIISLFDVFVSERVNLWSSYFVPTKLIKECFLCV